jgi:hypothetical protein
LTGLRLRTIAIGILLALMAGVVLFSWLTLSYVYSEGERAGILQKFSRKGWLCKTFEGELAMYVVAGIQPEIWLFSVRDEKLAAQLANQVGRRVQLHYTEHPGVPSSCFADTRYFVDRVSSIGEPAPAAPR